jgi:ABC-type glycerol-3-phosphate transport system substrate-binding protein
MAMLGRFLGVVTSLIVLAGCGGGSSGGSSTSTTPVSNTTTVEVSLGPANNYVNGILPRSPSVCRAPPIAYRSRTSW